MAWQIALLGSDTYIEPDENSEVALEDLDTDDPMTDSDWLKFTILGGPLNREQLDNITEGGGNTAIHTRGQKKLYKLDFADFVFPEEHYKVAQLDALLNHQWIYFYKGTYDFPNTEHPELGFSLHADEKCLLVAAFKSIEDVYEEGVTRITVNMRAVNPV